MTNNTLQPPKFVTEEAGFQDLLHIWGKRATDGEDRLDLGVAADPTVTADESTAILAAIAGGLVTSNPEFKGVPVDEQDEVIALGSARFLATALVSVAPSINFSHPGAIPDPQVIVEDEEAVQALSIWVDGARTAYVIEFANDPNEFPQDTLARLLIAPVVEATSQEDGVVDETKAYALLDLMRAELAAYLARTAAQ